MKTSKDPRHQSRRIAVAYVYSKESNSASSYSASESLDEIIEVSLDGLEIKNYDKNLLEIIASELSKNVSEYKNTIVKNSIDWDISKMYRMDLSILIVATCEMLTKQTPPKVIIDEAVELAKEFGSEESSKFINGILGGIAKSLIKFKEYDN